MISTLISIDSYGEFSSFYALLDQDIIVLDHFLCWDQTLAIIDLARCERASSSIGLHDDRIAYEWRYQILYTTPSSEKE
jgi:hypothetical protein